MLVICNARALFFSFVCCDVRNNSRARKIFIFFFEKELLFLLLQQKEIFFLIRYLEYFTSSRENIKTNERRRGASVLSLSLTSTFPLFDFCFAFCARFSHKVSSRRFRRFSLHFFFFLKCASPFPTHTHTTNTKQWRHGDDSGGPFRMW